MRPTLAAGQARAVTTGGWPWNGLSREENRELFGCAIPSGGEQRCVQLVVEGLMRLDWKPSRRQQG
jgi:hypothetical protein